MVPFEVPPAAEFEVTQGTSGCLVVDIPSRCLIAKLVVVQTNGVLNNFTVALYNKAEACAGLGQSASAEPLPDPHPGILPDDIWRVSPDMAGTAGKLLYFSDEATGGFGLVFVGQDKIPGDHRKMTSRKLYIKITPAGSGTTTYAVGVGGMAFSE